MAFLSRVRDRLSIDHGPPWAYAAWHARHIPPRRGPHTRRVHVVSPAMALAWIVTPATFTCFWTRSPGPDRPLLPALPPAMRCGQLRERCHRR